MDDSMMIIDDYLSLVRSNLPSEIADEVINELRVYLVEAAQEIGQGLVTAASAKMAVSRFGAPSEVAEEYKSSMLLESSEAAETQEPKQRTIDSLLKELKRSESVIQVRFLIWVVLFAIVVFLVPIMITPGHYTFYGIFLESVVVAMVGIILLKLYFRFRHYYLETFGSPSVFGQRSRVEMSGDALISLALTVFPFRAIVSALRGNMFYYVQTTRGHFSYTTTGMPILILVVAYHVSLLLGLFIRGVADLYDLRWAGQEWTCKAIIVSGALITLSIGIKIGIVTALIASSAFLYSFNSVLVILTCIIAFQVLASHMKLVEKNKNGPLGKSEQ
jgi:uncharacterized membrane protein